MNCDKCGREVASNNDATLMDAILTGDGRNILFHHARHLLPVLENGEVVCEGSPSRAQYLEDQPRDERGFDYRPELEEQFRAAFQEMQKEDPSLALA